LAAALPPLPGNPQEHDRQAVRVARRRAKLISGFTIIATAQNRISGRGVHVAVAMKAVG
jgi:hypothetical protein